MPDVIPFELHPVVLQLHLFLHEPDSQDSEFHTKRNGALPEQVRCISLNEPQFFSKEIRMRHFKTERKIANLILQKRTPKERLQQLFHKFELSFFIFSVLM